MPWSNNNQVKTMQELDTRFEQYCIADQNTPKIKRILSITTLISVKTMDLFNFPLLQKGRLVTRYKINICLANKLFLYKGGNSLPGTLGCK